MRITKEFVIDHYDEIKDIFDRYQVKPFIKFDTFYTVVTLDSTADIVDIENELMDLCIKYNVTCTFILHGLYIFGQYVPPMPGSILFEHII